MTLRTNDRSGDQPQPISEGTLRSKRIPSVAALGLGTLGLGTLGAVALLLGALFSSSEALASPDKPGDSSHASDPTVGTLPLMGGGQADLDQTITLRGNLDDLREVLVDASGDGFVEVIDVGEGNAWARFYGDIRVELSADALSNIKVGVFAGFEGGGMRYVVRTAQGYGTVQGLLSGYELPVDLVRLSNAGLLDEPTYIYTMHRTGARTVTSMETDPVTGNVVIYQDV